MKQRRPHKLYPGQTRAVDDLVSNTEEEELLQLSQI